LLGAREALFKFFASWHLPLLSHAWESSDGVCFCSFCQPLPGTCTFSAPTLEDTMTPADTRSTMVASFKIQGRSPNVE
jgi:hypothetical protein